MPSANGRRRSFAAALLCSLAVHALFAFALLTLPGRGDATDATATIDLSYVELSVAEVRDDAAEAVADVPAATRSGPVGPKPAERPPEPDAVMPPAPAPAAAEMRVPDERPRNLSPPVRARDQARVEAPPRPERNIRPEYPAGARRRGEEGEVVLEVAVREDGRVESASVVVSSGHRDLDEAARRTVCAATFVPARSGGVAVASTVRMKFCFRLTAAR